MATLFLAEAGAKVIKIERPGKGDDMRSYTPVVEGEGVNFTVLNRAKRSIAIDLKDPLAKEKLRPLLEKADVLIEQFRPGVMARLGLGYEDIRAINHDIIYCSITGWGQNGPKALEAGHDLNYMAETGVLGLSVGADGAPILPPILAADIAGGAYPATINILLALIHRNKTGEGAWIDVAMGENLFPFLYWALGNAHALNRWPVAGGETVTGGSPRYALYRTKDERYIAVAALEDKFWASFTALLGLSTELCDDQRDPAATRAAIAELIVRRDAAEWAETFRGVDVCCSVVARLDEALRHPHWAERGLFKDTVALGGGRIPALPTVVAPTFRVESSECSAPSLGEGNAELLFPSAEST
jgi:crotonobetainyl-CoA:carnitine CoA-transferase CaiB-like acyl-CoA transferase